MHPYFAQELARERRRELLGQQQFRHRQKPDVGSRALQAAPVGRARRSLGRTFVALGARLLGDEPTTVELFTSRR
jgi:hypothetical protein